MDPLSLLRVLTHVTKHDREMTATKLQVFLLIWREDGITIKDIAERVGVTQSTISRVLSQLADKPARGAKTALNWVEAFPDKDDPRRFRMTLTPAGKRVVEEIRNL